jgi:hypothetical protein
MSSEYNLTSVDTTEELLQNDICPGISHKGWTRYRINYRNEFGFSNIEGTIYFPPGFDGSALLETIEEEFNTFIEVEKTEGNPL